MDYKDYLNLFDNEPIYSSEKDSKRKYYIGRKHLKMTKYEMKPRIAFAYYSRYLEDPFAYQEIDLAAVILNKLRTTSHYIVTDYTKRSNNRPNLRLITTDPYSTQRLIEKYSWNSFVKDLFW